MVEDRLIGRPFDVQEVQNMSTGAAKVAELWSGCVRRSTGLAGGGFTRLVSHPLDGNAAPIRPLDSASLV